MSGSRLGACQRRRKHAKDAKAVARCSRSSVSDTPYVTLCAGMVEQFQRMKLENYPDGQVSLSPSLCSLFCLPSVIPVPQDKSVVVAIVHATCE
jgi:hypothetical protein